MLKDCPCKVIQVKTAKTGKHGHAKCNITGKDVRDGKKKHELQPGHIVMRAFDFKKVDVEVTDVNEEASEFTYLDENFQEVNVRVDFTDEKKADLVKFLEAYNANVKKKGDKLFSISVITVPVGKAGKEVTQILATGWKEMKDTD